MEVRWKAWTPATTPDKARRVVAPLLEKLGGDESSLQIEPYPKTNGHVMSFKTRIEDRPWAEVVLALLRSAQSVGHGWGFGGNLDHELQLSTNHVSSTGITLLDCWVRRGYGSQESTTADSTAESES